MKFLFDHDVPDDLSYLLNELGQDVTLLRAVLPRDTSDEAVFRFAHVAGCILLTCNRDDFLDLAATQPHHGVVIIIRRRTRGEERAALFGCSTVPARQVSETTSISPDQRASDLTAAAPALRGSLPRRDSAGSWQGGSHSPSLGRSTQRGAGRPYLWDAGYLVETKLSARFSDRESLQHHPLHRSQNKLVATTKSYRSDVYRSKHTMPRQRKA